MLLLLWAENHLWQKWLPCHLKQIKMAGCDLLRICRQWPILTAETKPSKAFLGNSTLRTFLWHLLKISSYNMACSSGEQISGALDVTEAKCYMWIGLATVSYGWKRCYKVLWCPSPWYSDPSWSEGTQSCAIGETCGTAPVSHWHPFACFIF